MKNLLTRATLCSPFLLYYIMGIFTKKSESRAATVVVAPKTFGDKLADVKAMFKKAHEDADALRNEMLVEIASKQCQIESLQSEINNIEATKADTEKFITNIEQFL